MRVAFITCIRYERQIVCMEKLTLTEFRMHANGPKVGRKKLWTERLTLTLNEEIVRRLDAVRDEGEPRLDLIRAGIELEIARREALPRKKDVPAVEQSDA